MKKLLLLLLTLISISSFSQNEDSVISSPDNTHIYYGIGAAGQNFAGIGSRIALRPEYEALRKTEASLSIGLTREINSLMVDYNLSFGSSLSGDRERKSSSIISFGYSFTLGVNLCRNYSPRHRIKLWPFAGIGIQTFKVALNKDLAAVPFDSVLQSTNWQQRTAPLRFSNTFFTYKTGVAIDFVSKHNKRSAYGLRAGYIGSFKSKDWRINEEQVLANAPTDKLSRWFATLQVTGIFKKRNKS